MKRILAVLALMLCASQAQAQQQVDSNVFRAISSAVYAYTGTQAVLAMTFSAYTRVIQAVCQTSCFINTAPTPFAATATGQLLVAQLPYIIRVNQGEKIAVIRDTASGNIYITELTR